MKRIGLLAAWAVPALALANPLDVQLIPTVVEGQGHPAVVVTANQPIEWMRLKVSRQGCGATSLLSMRTAALAPGAQHRFDLDQPVGRCAYSGTLSARIAGQTAEMPLEFTGEIAGTPEVKPLPHAIDAAAHLARVTFNREAERGTVESFAEDGKSFAPPAEQPLGDERPGSPLTLSYDHPGDRPIARLRVTVYDSVGIFGAVDLYPWALNIPHQEVVFASGSADIGAAERPKLEESLGRIAAALARIGDQIPVRLFVAGYTDTVGSADANQQLSAARAQSIANFFRQNGLKVPIQIAGLGEQALAVATPDETPEPRNRRAEYIVAVDAPEMKGASGNPNWKPLP